MYYIMLTKTKAGISSTYSFLTTVEAETGATIKKSFATLADAQAYVKEMLESGAYALSDFIVIKGVAVAIDATLTEETA